jgi:uncharacterized protein YtpQ (UPF0354 family)
MGTDIEFCRRAIAYVKPALPVGGATVVVSYSDELALLSLQNGLLVSYLVDEGPSFTYIQNRHLAGAGIGVEELHKFGCDNLAEIAKRQLKVHAYGSIYAVLLDGNFEASLILIDGLWEKGLAKLVSTGFTAALPARDILAFCDSSSTAGIAELKSLVNRLDAPDHPISSNLFHRADGKWMEIAA